jgi:hypothetical protein
MPIILMSNNSCKIRPSQFVWMTHKYISLDARFLECSVVGDLVELWPQMAMGKARKPL